MHQAFELLTLQQTGKTGKVPIVFYDSNYWQPMLDFIKKSLMGKYKTISKGDDKLFHVVNSVDEAVNIITARPREGSKKRRRLK